MPITSSSSWFLLQRHPGGTAKAVYGEATYSQVPRDGRRPTVHDLPCEASRSAKMGEGRSDRNLYAQVGAARRRNQGGDGASAPTLGSKCRDLPGRPGEGRGGNPSGGPRGRARAGGAGVGTGRPRRPWGASVVISPAGPGRQGGNPSGGPWGRAGGGTGPRKSENGGKGV